MNREMKNNQSKNAKIIDILVDSLYEELVTPEEQKFLDLVFSKNPTQEALDTLLETWDIETTAGARQALLLSYLMKAHPELKFNDYTAPRLRGLLNFHRHKNIRTLSWFAKAGRALNREGIVPMIFKGAAIKALRPDLSRIMADVDILVPQEILERTAAITEEVGFKFARYIQAGKTVDIKGERHAFDMVTEDGHGEIDIHRYILTYSWARQTGLKSAPEFNKVLFERAQKTKAFGVEVLMPSYEDLAFIALNSLVRNIVSKESLRGILFTLFDLQYLTSKENFDWSIVFGNAKITDSEASIKIGAEFVERLAPGLLPAQLREGLPYVGHIKDEYNRIVFEGMHFSQMRIESRALKLKEVWRRPSLWAKYLSIKPKYLRLKSIRNKPEQVEAYLRKEYAYK